MLLDTNFYTTLLFTFTPPVEVDTSLPHAKARSTSPDRMSRGTCPNDIAQMCYFAIAQGALPSRIGMKEM